MFLKPALTIREVAISTIEEAPTIGALMAEYAEESGINGMPQPTARWHAYRLLQVAGRLFSFAAFIHDELVGFIFVVAADLPHYGTTTSAVSESFFVARAHRKTGAGLRLLRRAEEMAREIGAPGLLVTAPFEGDLFRVLPRIGYTEVSRAFFKKVT